MFPCDREIILLADNDPVNLNKARNTPMGQYRAFTIPRVEKMFHLLEIIASGGGRYFDPALTENFIAAVPPSG
jgi:hypothetical protein